MDRRVFLTAALAGLAQAASAQDPVVLAPAPVIDLGGKAEPYFVDWLAAFYAKATAAGIDRAVLDRELAGLTPDPRVPTLDAAQPEFSRPVGAYVQSAISDARVVTGRAKVASIPALSDIEAIWGVPRGVLIGIWAMESNYGAIQGDMDVVRSLATLAASNPRRRDWAEGELIAALRILASGQVARARLRGSWAGAMGQTQVLPSTYLATAVDQDGDGRKDVWDSAPDALATAAHLLANGGWRRDEGWAVEVTLPAGFDWSLSEGPKEPFAFWAAKGARRADGAAWPIADAAAPGILLAPSGAAGPAFLALPNHFVIRTYNNSLAYALAVGLLADRIAGGAGVIKPWPHETPLSLTQRMDAQAALSELGFDAGIADGKIGLATRQALRAWQKSQGLVADGYLTPELIERLRAAATKG
jgi:lytic murein transglycosylase